MGISPCEKLSVIDVGTHPLSCIAKALAAAPPGTTSNVNEPGAVP
jgi:hypothetical protein